MYVENLKELKKKILLKLKNKFTRITTGYKVNTLESTVFLYTSDKQLETKNQKILYLQSLKRKRKRRRKRWRKEEILRYKPSRTRSGSAC